MISHYSLEDVIGKKKLAEAMNMEKSIWRVAVAPMKMPSHKKAENPAREWLIPNKSKCRLPG